MLPIAIVPILPSQFDHVGDEPLFVVPATRYMTLGGAMLTKSATGTAFRDA